MQCDLAPGNPHRQKLKPHAPRRIGDPFQPVLSSSPHGVHLAFSLLFPHSSPLHFYTTCIHSASCFPTLTLVSRGGLPTSKLAIFLERFLPPRRCSHSRRLLDLLFASLLPRHPPPLSLQRPLLLPPRLIHYTSTPSSLRGYPAFNMSSSDDDQPLARSNGHGELLPPAPMLFRPVQPRWKRVSRVEVDYAAPRTRLPSSLVRLLLFVCA